MKKIRNLFILSCLMWIFSISNLEAQEVDSTCYQNGVERLIQLRMNPAPDILCDVYYQKPSENVAPSSLWTAKNDLSFCKEKYEYFSSKLKNMGWNCETSSTAVRYKRLDYSDNSIDYSNNKVVEDNGSWVDVAQAQMNTKTYRVYVDRCVESISYDYGDSSAAACNCAANEMIKGGYSQTDLGTLIVQAGKSDTENGVVIDRELKNLRSVEAISLSACAAQFTKNRRSRIADEYLNSCISTMSESYGNTRNICNCTVDNLLRASMGDDGFRYLMMNQVDKQEYQSTVEEFAYINDDIEIEVMWNCIDGRP